MKQLKTLKINAWMFLSLLQIILFLIQNTIYICKLQKQSVTFN